MCKCVLRFTFSTMADTAIIYISSGCGIHLLPRLIKSHTSATSLSFLKSNWPSNATWTADSTAAGSPLPESEIRSYHHHIGTPYVRGRQMIRICVVFCICSIAFREVAPIHLHSGRVAKAVGNKKSGTPSSSSRLGEKPTHHCWLQASCNITSPLYTNSQLAIIMLEKQKKSNSDIIHQVHLSHASSVRESAFFSDNRREMTTKKPRALKANGGESLSFFFASQESTRRCDSVDHFENHFLC